MKKKLYTKKKKNKRRGWKKKNRRKKESSRRYLVVGWFGQLLVCFYQHKQNERQVFFSFLCTVYVTSHYVIFFHLSFFYLMGFLVICCFKFTRKWIDRIDRFISIHPQFHRFTSNSWSFLIPLYSWLVLYMSNHTIWTTVVMKIIASPKSI